MDHVAIMTKSWGLIPKILSGEKTIESRWYKTRRAPWDKVSGGDIVYFKNSGESVTSKAVVSRIKQYSDLNIADIKKIYRNFGEAIGVRKRDIAKATQYNSDKRYCVLVFLENPEKVKPFNINSIMSLKSLFSDSYCYSRYNIIYIFKTTIMNI